MLFGDHVQEQRLTITYVTDPDLEPEAQKRVLGNFMDCGEDLSLRVAFRLPNATDEEVRPLIEWYLACAHADRLLPPLVHGRTEVAKTFPGCHLWLPARELQFGDTPAWAYSVHSQTEALLAVEHGGAEVIYGHVFPTESHPGEPARGVTTLGEIADSGVLVTAIGGINERTVGSLHAVGVSRIAMIRAVSRSPDIAVSLHLINTSWHAGE